VNYRHDAKRFKPITLTQKVNPRPSARFKYPGRTYTYCTVEGHAEDSIPVVLTGQPPFSLEVEIKHAGSSKPQSLTINKIEKDTYDLRIPKNRRQQGHSHISIRQVTDSRGCQSKVEVAGIAPRVQLSVHEPPTIVPLEAKGDYCVGERLSFRLSGSPPFNIFYTWKGKERKASSGAIFNRIADNAGDFIINGVSDSASECRARVDNIHKTIHALPKANIARGRDEYTDIHEGGEVELTFELVGDAPFEFTYTRAALPRRNEDSGPILETHTERTDEKSLKVMASEEGVYEVISVRDRWCVSSKQGAQAAGKGQKLLVQ
jgi:nucleoporin POM152